LTARPWRRLFRDATTPKNLFGTTPPSNGNLFSLAEVTPEETAESPAEPTSQAPSTAGMTTKVVKGSLWTLVGQVGPLAVSLITTPFVIRMLGADSYGVLILVGLIPTYFGFADFGMGVASTKFASEAFAEGDLVREARIVRTAALLALCSSLPISVVLFTASSHIISFFAVPENLHGEASLALKFSAITFVLNFLNSIFNTPQLTRLRMDLNTLVTAGFRMLGLIATPFAIYFEGIVGAVFVLMVSSLLTLIGHLFVSGGLVRHLFEITVDREVIGRLIKFGGNLAKAGIAAVLLVNLEKLVLARVASVEDLAHYSVAFTFATLATNFSGSMSQSLIPAFSQLLGPEKAPHLLALYSRGIRYNVLGLLPILVALVLIARPFFTVWAGADFGRESTLPFYILSVGVFFHLTGYVSGSLLMALGRTDIIAKAFWIELIPYIGLTGLLTFYFGAIGAATAWSMRVIVEAIVLLTLGQKIGHIEVRLSTHAFAFAAGGVILLPGLLLVLYFQNPPLWSYVVAVVCFALYAIVLWKNFIDDDERSWISGKIFWLSKQRIPYAFFR
jgi:O-antigen/teichoic acid export membrane protein